MLPGIPYLLQADGFSNGSVNKSEPLANNPGECKTESEQKEAAGSAATETSGKAIITSEPYHEVRDPSTETVDLDTAARFFGRVGQNAADVFWTDVASRAERPAWKALEAEAWRAWEALEVILVKQIAALGHDGPTTAASLICVRAGYVGRLRQLAAFGWGGAA